MFEEKHLMYLLSRVLSVSITPRYKGSGYRSAVSVLLTVRFRSLRFIWRDTKTEL